MTTATENIEPMYDLSCEAYLRQKDAVGWSYCCLKSRNHQTKPLDCLLVEFKLL